MALNEGQIVTLAIDEVIETITNMTPMASKTSKYTPPAASMQRSGNTIWMPVEQEAPTQEGWDLTEKETGITELNVAVNLGEPDNDFFGLRADDVRDETSYRRRINASAIKLANNLEVKIANMAVEMGSLVVSDKDQINVDPAKGWDFMSQGESLIFARELNRSSGLSWFFNSDDYRRAGYNLVGRDLYGRIAEDAYRKGNIQRQVAGFDDVMRSPKLPSIEASEATGITVKGAQSFKPISWKLDNDNNKVNVDNRFATVTLSSTTGLKRGDKISFAGVKFLAQLAKNVLTQDATFSVVRVIDETHVDITPKPIALDDTTLLPEQRAYANVNTSLADGAAINILNTATVKSNVFWADDSIRIISQPIPASHDLFAGMKTTSFNIPDVGINGIFATQGDISTLTGLCRIAVWYGVNATQPEAIGVGLPGQKA
ncbi:MULTISPECIES: P22 phage major capsid protein family protein [unclassified Arsenophonus]|uniref:P22 phage major capsid protein family protein n=1 Tax=unclassified Arsenophonus TaxID=2627083 RepID=UPI00285DF042|nr:P22 phage major capsid protein family protein [Arsenophonus sp.]MDR5615058.1 P22 phage major capsid protein family protein [Arsenophonus sp.]